MKNSKFIALTLIMTVIEEVSVIATVTAVIAATPNSNSQ